MGEKNQTAHRDCCQDSNLGPSVRVDVFLPSGSLSHPALWDNASEDSMAFIIKSVPSRFALLGLQTTLGK